MKPKTQCEICGRPATHVCSGLDVPAVKFCAGCAHIHALECPEVRAGEAVMVRMGQNKCRDKGEGATTDSGNMNYPPG